nr:ribonuclease H-like domain-containing protein [Tanacetum cinerariifolium]GEY62733.1 ribonuclease H-like domain-containing protein [Tanacetum cinerariifolium]
GFENDHFFWTASHIHMYYTGRTRAMNLSQVRVVLVVPKHNRDGYVKPICIKYEWEFPHCGKCLLYDHSLVDFPKASPNQTNGIEQGEGQISGVSKRVSHEEFIVVNRKGVNPKKFNGILMNKKTKYRSIAKKTTNTKFKKNGANSGGKKKQSIQEVSNSNPFNALNYVENDDDLFNSRSKSDSDNEVEEVFNKTAAFMASTSLKSNNRSGYGTKSLLEQLRETTLDYDYNPYDDDACEGHDIFENLQAIEESSQPPQPPIASTKTPRMVSSVKLPILKKGEYILWTMNMELYLAHTDYALWEVILNGNIAVQMSKDEASNETKALLVTAYTDELNAAYSISTATGHSSQAQDSSSYADELMFTFFPNQSKDEATDFALMAFTLNPSSSSSSNSEEDVTEIVFDNRSSDEENSVANDRFKKGKGYHAVPPPLTGNYMPSKPNLSFARLDDPIYKFKISETVTSLAKDEDNAPEASTAFVENPKKIATSHSRRNSTERVNTAGSKAVSAVKGNEDHPHQALKNKGIVNSGCSRHMTMNKAYHVDYQKIHDGGFVAFGLSRCKIIGKGTIRTEKLDFDDVYFVNE